jgi:O-antigen ligase
VGFFLKGFEMSTGYGNSMVAGLGGGVSGSWLASVRVQLVKLLVLVAFVLCMSAPEELLFSQAENDLNPFAGTVKLILLGLGSVILLLSGTRKRHWAIALPFSFLIGWAIICWFVTGAEMLPARNLVSSFGGILLVAAFCAATEYVGSVRGMVRLLVWAVLITTIASVFLGLLELQPMPGESRLPGEMEWFHGIGQPGYAVAGCAVLIAWLLAKRLTGTGSWLEPKVLLLLAIPALAFLRAFLIGIIASILLAVTVGYWRSRQTRGRIHQEYNRRFKRLLLLSATTLAVGAAIFFLKTGSREEGNELSGRQIIWPIEIASVIQHPAFGLGPFGDIELLRFKEDLPQMGAAHSDFLGSAVCYGLPGLALFVGAVYSLWRRIVRYSPANFDERVCRYAAFFSMAVVSTAMIAENVIRDPRLFSLYLLFPALCLSAAAAHQQGEAA